jgi:hypothetical protein
MLRRRGLDQPAGSIGHAQRAHLRAVAVRTELARGLLVAFKVTRPDSAAADPATAALADEYAPFPGELVAAHTREMVAVRLLLERY